MKNAREADAITTSRFTSIVIRETASSHQNSIYQIIKDQFPQATLDVIVRDIIKVLMFSLQSSKYRKFDHWYHSFMKTIEDLNLLYGEITWEQTYLQKQNENE